LSGASFEYHHFNSSYKADCSVYWSSRDGNNFVIEFSYKYHSGVSGLGIETSAVKHISGKHKENDLSSVSTMVSTVKKLVLVTGIFWRATGDIFFLVGTITFGNTDYTLAFIFISVTVLLKQLASGQLVVLQSLRK
jgi:O-antigen/teichoic acid export membrane protein